MSDESFNGLNGEIIVSIKDQLIGYAAGSDYYSENYKGTLRVTFDIRIERLMRKDEYETVNHDMVSRPLDFSLTCTVWDRRKTDHLSGGATTEPLARLVKYARGWDRDRVRQLRELFALHLSSVNAGCAHVRPAYARDSYGRNVPSLDLTPACPVTGYRYGHAWLVRPLPESFPGYVRTLCDPGAVTPVRPDDISEAIILARQSEKEVKRNA